MRTPLPGRDDDAADLSLHTTDYLLLACLAVVTGVITWGLTGQILELQSIEKPSVAADDIPDRSLAVLPFENLSQDEATDSFALGIHDDTLTQISRITDIKVISRTSVMEYRGTTRNLKTIGDELGVTTILEGGVQRAGDRVRINAQLIDARTDEHLWAETYDRQLTAANIFAIQTEIATAIARALRTELSTETQIRLEQVPTKSMQALEMYFAGRQAMSKRTSKSLVDAVDYFRQAAQFDPGFALAYVGLADSLTLQVSIGGLPRAETYAMAEEAIDAALKLDDQLGEAQPHWVGFCSTR